MTSREDFKQAIAMGNINEAFMGKQQSDGNESEVDNYLRTHINLIEGKIENEIGEKLTSDRYGEIQQFHIRQVTQGHQTIQHNLVSLQKMFQLMSAFQQHNSEHRSWVDIAADVSRESLSSQPEAERLSGNRTSALSGGKTARQTQAITPSANADNQEIEPQLPSFEEEDGVVDDLLSLTDLDENAPATTTADPQANKEDWGEWLEEEETEAKPEVFNLKSLNIKEAQNWQNWDASQPEKE